MAESHKHRLLKQVALRWVRGVGCCAFACEVSFVYIGVVDVMGLKERGDVYVIEAKISNADFRNDFKPRGIYELPKVERFGLSRQIDFVYYIVAHDVDTAELPEFIGILNEAGVVKRRAKRQNRDQTGRTLLDSFVKIAKALSWRKYGHVINHEQEQMEFSLMEVQDGRK